MFGTYTCFLPDYFLPRGSGYFSSQNFSRTIPHILHLCHTSYILTYENGNRVFRNVGIYCRRRGITQKKPCDIVTCSIHTLPLIMTSYPPFKPLFKYRFTERTYASYIVIFHIPSLPRLVFLKLLSNNFTLSATNSSFDGSAHYIECSSSPRIKLFPWK
jgi:hypothetical protein